MPNACRDLGKGHSIGLEWFLLVSINIFSFTRDLLNNTRDSIHKSLGSETMAKKLVEGSEGMANKSIEGQTLRLHYGNKDWLVIVCRLNGHSLILHQTFIKAHISKQECIDMFGDKKSSNGYKVSKNPDFIDQTMWL